MSDNEDTKTIKVKMPKNFKPREPKKRKASGKRWIDMSLPKKTTQNATLEALMEIAGKEIARFQAIQTEKGALSDNDTKRLATLIDAYRKLLDEHREVKKQSVLEGKSDEEIADLVREAMSTLGVGDSDE